MGWVAGFALGALGGFTLGWLLAPGARGWLGASAARSARRDAMAMLPDERLTRAARQRLVARGIINPRLDVTTVDGVIYLRGRVRDAGEAALAAEVVGSTPGVERVVNELTVPESA